MALIGSFLRGHDVNQQAGANEIKKVFFHGKGVLKCVKISLNWSSFFGLADLPGKAPFSSGGGGCLVSFSDFFCKNFFRKKCTSKRDKQTPSKQKIILATVLLYWVVWLTQSFFGLNIITEKLP